MEYQLPKRQMNVLFMTEFALIPSRGGIERVLDTLKKELNSRTGIKVFSCSPNSGPDIEDHFYIDWDHYAEELQKLLAELKISILVIHITAWLSLIRMMKPLKDIHIPNLKIIIEHHHIAGFKYLFDQSIYYTGKINRV